MAMIEFVNRIFYQKCRRDKMKKLAALPILIILTLSVLTAGDNNLLNKNSKQKKLWENKKISSYILVQEVDDQQKNSFVEFGVATASTAGKLNKNNECKLRDVDFKTVDDLFNLVTKLSIKYDDNLKVQYHADLGYPVRIGVMKGSEVKCMVKIKELIYMTSE